VRALPRRSICEQRHACPIAAAQSFLTSSPSFPHKKHSVLRRTSSGPSLQQNVSHSRVTRQWSGPFHVQTPRLHESPTRVHNLDIAPGDVLFVKGNGCLEQMGTAGGFMGHVILVLASPQRVEHCSRAFEDLGSMWSPEALNEVWSIHS